MGLVGLGRRSVVVGWGRGVGMGLGRGVGFMVSLVVLGLFITLVRAAWFLKPVLGFKIGGV